MGCRRHDLQEAFFVPGTHAFRVWGYGTADPLAEVLRPGYFAAVTGMLRPGELIWVSSQPGTSDCRVGKRQGSQLCQSRHVSQGIVGNLGPA